MKHYLKFEIESDEKEIIMRVEPIYCSLTDDDVLGIKTDDYIPTKGDKLYFLPGVNIPRVKLKDLTMQYDIKSVRNIDDATHIFAGKNSRPKMVNNSWSYRLPTEEIRKIFEEVKDHMDEFYSENVREVLDQYTEDVIILDYSSASDIRNTENVHLGKASQTARDFLYSSDIIQTVVDEYKSFFPAILSLEIYDESKLLKYINGADAVTIDEDMYEQLSVMFKSSDTDNHILAMEIMANSNYIDSLLYMEILFKEYAYVISNCHTRNHVNFKSLLSFLGKDKNYLHTSLDEVVESLITKGVFTIEMAEILMKRYASEIESRGDTTYFKIKTITLSEEATKAINENFIHTSREDYVLEKRVLPEVVDDIEITDEDIETAISRIERNELKEELIALDIANPITEEELMEPEKGPIEESNNNQIEENNGDGFEWF